MTIKRGHSHSNRSMLLGFGDEVGRCDGRLRQCAGKTVAHVSHGWEQSLVHYNRSVSCKVDYLSKNNHIVAIK